MQYIAYIGKIYVEGESAKLHMMMSKIYESEGDLAKACEIIQGECAHLFYSLCVHKCYNEPKYKHIPAHKHKHQMFMLKHMGLSPNQTKWHIL